MIETFKQYFGEIEDPRIDRTKKHALIDIILTAVCAILGGAETYEDIRLFGKAHEKWLSKYVPLANGIPSEDTFMRLFNNIDHLAFQKASVEWLRSLEGLFTSTYERTIAIDGKALRGSAVASTKCAALHVISAFSADNRVTLAQVATDSKSNEITAIPKILELLDLQGATVTIDAMGRQKKIVDAIVSKGGDYIISLKDNQAGLFKDAQNKFAACDEGVDKTKVYSAQEKLDLAHGRIDKRQLESICAENIRKFIDYDWAGLRSIIRITTHQMVKDQLKIETRFLISSLSATNPSQILELARTHWGIENSLHWSLDVTLGEDRSRIRHENGALNFAWARRLALGVLKNMQLSIRPRMSIRLKQRLLHAKPELLVGAVLKVN